MLEIFKIAEIPKGQLFSFFFLTILFVLLEGGGLSVMLPILAYVEQGNNGDISSFNSMFSKIEEICSFFNVSLNLFVLILFAAIPMLARQAVLFFKTVIIGQIEFEFAHKLRISVMSEIINAGLAFYLKNSQGRLTSSLTTEAEQSASVIRAYLELLSSILLLCVYATIILFISPLMAVISLPIFVVSGLVVKRQLSNSARIGTGIGETSQKFNENISELIKSTRLIKGRAIEGYIKTKIRYHSEDMSSWKLQLLRAQCLIEAMVNPILILGVFLVLYISVEYLNMKLAELGMFLFIIGRATPLILQINNARLTTRNSLMIKKRVDALIDEARAEQDCQGGKEQFEGAKYSIEFDNVSFKYRDINEAKYTLDKINFSILQGETVALVGPSGAGKSTLVDLIPRYYDLTEGSILIDGKDIKLFALDQLRRKIAYVTQDSIFFHDSVRANIEFGLEESLSDDFIWECLEKSHADDFIKNLPEGLDTIIGEQGKMLSGGQRQRLAIARALAQKTSILILDEPTSALDAASEEKVQSSIQKLHGELTILIIAHRLSTIRHADKIVYLEDGRLMGYGKHSKLIKTLPAYSQMVELQNIG
jgi:ABC-type multidrug transport system fused ATPase/permease subunit